MVAVMAAMAVLLLPALSQSKSKGLRIACVNNLKEQGLALSLYSTDFSDALPTRSSAQETYPHHGYFLFADSLTMAESPALGTRGAAVENFRPGLNHGLFSRLGLIPDGKVYYCPGIKQGIAGYTNYLTPAGKWPAYNTDPTANPYVRSSYVFYPLGHESVYSNRADAGKFANKFHELSSSSATMTDFVSTYEAIPHCGEMKPESLNVLWGDMRVTPSSTKAAFDRALWGYPDNLDAPNSNPVKFHKIISLLKP